MKANDYYGPAPAVLNQTSCPRITRINANKNSSNLCSGYSR